MIGPTVLPEEGAGDVKRQASRIRMMAVLAAVLCLGLVSTSGMRAQEATNGDNRWTPSRLPDGQPNMEGVYISGWSGPQERWTEAERKEWEEKMVKLRGPNPSAYGREWTERELHDKPAYVPKPGTVMVIDPPEGRIPWQPWAKAKQNYIRDNWFERPEFVDSRVRCLPAGPRHTFPSGYNGWQVLQPPGYVIILQEHNHNYRVIPIDRNWKKGDKIQHPPANVQLWMGDSRGHWEGNTLVIDVTNFTDKTWVMGEIGGEGMSVGSFHSPALHMVERWTMRDANNIDYEATIEDPNVFTRPWKMRFGVWKRAPAGYENYEYACHEGNRWNELTSKEAQTTRK